MSKVAIRNENEPRTPIQSVAFGQGEAGGQIAPQSLGDILRFAEVMARADVAIPKHLRDNPGACLAVCMQAFNWSMNPFAVAQKSYKVNDIIAYEAQLIAAVINTRAGLKHRPSIEFEGEGGQRRCIVTFEASDGSTHIYRSPITSAISPKNSPLWKTDPDQQLGYYSVRAGARRHFPEVLLGVYDRDELDGARDVTPSAGPTRSAFATRIASQPHSEPLNATEGFDAGFIDGELGARPDPSSEPDENVDALPGDSVGHEADDRRAEIEPRFDSATTEKLARYARALLGHAVADVEPTVRRDRITKEHTTWRPEMVALAEDATEVAKKAFSAAQSVASGKTSDESARDFLADEIGVEAASLIPGAA